MEQTIPDINTPQFNHNKTHPKELLLWLAYGSFLMFFTAFFSVYIYKKSSGAWSQIDVPNGFIYSTLLMLVSGLTFYLSYTNFKKGMIKRSKHFLYISLIVGISFMLAQWFSWQEMFDRGDFVIVKDNVAGTLIFILSGCHLLHVLGGIVPMTWLSVKAGLNQLDYRLSLGFKLTHSYWHFLGALWLYIYLFLLVNQY